MYLKIKLFINCCYNYILQDLVMMHSDWFNYKRDNILHIILFTFLEIQWHLYWIMRRGEREFWKVTTRATFVQTERSDNFSEKNCKIFLKIVYYGLSMHNYYKTRKKRLKRTLKRLYFNVNLNSNMTSFFRFVDKRAIYRWYNLIRTCASECDWLPLAA